MDQTKRAEQTLCAALSGEPLPEPLPEGYRLERPARGAPVFYGGFPISRFYLLLHGQCTAEVYSEQGASAVASVMQPVQVLGVSELLRGMPSFHATVYAASDDCLLLSCPAREFMALTDASLPLARLMLRYLAQLMVNNMASFSARAFRSPKLALAQFLLDGSAGQPLPFTLQLSRKELADRLRINLRSLYRYLDALKAEGAVRSVRGRLTVDAENAAALQRLCGQGREP